jgi:two-component system NarL family response regulator
MDHITKAPLASTRSTIRVIIADGHPVAREGLSTVLGLAPDFQVVAQAADGMEACELYHQHSPDVLLVDIRIPGKDGFQVVEELMARRGTRPRIIVITTYESEDEIRRAVAAGAHGYLVKVAEPQQIREAVRQVAAGRTAFPTGIALDLAQSATTERSPDDNPNHNN